MQARLSLFCYVTRETSSARAALLVGRSRGEIREDCLNRLETLVAYSAKRSAGQAPHARLTLFVVPVLLRPQPGTHFAQP